MFAMKEKLFYPLLGVVVFLALVLFSQGLRPQSVTVNKNTDNPSAESQTKTPSSKSSSAERVLVTRVVDGDTIEIEGGQKVRYLGINTPETVDPRKTVQCFGKESSNKNKELVEGKKVRLEKDVSETDKYGRLLRYVYLPAEKGGGGEIFVNDYLVQEGYATATSYPPDIKYQDKFKAAETSARDTKKGLWGSCSLNSGQVQSSTNSSLTTLNSSSGCKIKGNISSSGEKIYHVPGGKYYDKTSIDENKGERWFCTEEQAQTAGWRASKL